jgi:putative nucleotidyltransferase-like protein
MQAVLQPELEALSACGAAPPEAVRRLSQLLSGSLNWPMLVALVDGEGMLPLFSRTLYQCPLDKVPPAILADIRSWAESKAMRSLSMAGELSRILRSLEAAGLAVIAFKGPTLAYLAYGDLALRDSADLDIFVPRHQVTAALEILTGDGYEKKSPGLNIDLAGDIEIALRRRNPACEVDLHWQFSPRYFLPFDAGRAAERSIIMRANGLTARTLCREDLLLYVSLHAARECWTLRSICDVAALVRNGNIDWDDVLREAGRAHCWRAVAVGLELAAALFQAPVPPDVWKRVKHEGAVAGIAAHLLSRLRRGEAAFEDSPSGALLHLRMIAGGSGKLRYLWHRAVHPKQTDVNFVQLPQTISAAYYLIRPFRVACTALWRLRR